MTQPDLVACSGARDVDDVRALLAASDLTISGLGEPGVHLWLARDETGVVVASTGYEASDDRRDVLVRSVAVDPVLRGRGLGLGLAQWALARAGESGATRAWLFSRRSGPFWQRTGFEPADRDELARRLATTHQVRQFVATGQLGREVAWTRPLSGG
ncbi:GNAT family N-acetyltransferase [Cellulomonas rhizosphaerae]|uniref:GNAT family N-acetyltransferase n=1 Tax=Cellulomonas rhizosphaerae TaxID=2293719 RepID=A0A413RNC8_9CELL|nr:GNAT family N-acetyltransferase [Cellulomonas rhizosphaerae]